MHHDRWCECCQRQVGTISVTFLKQGGFRDPFVICESCWDGGEGVRLWDADGIAVGAA